MKRYSLFVVLGVLLAGGCQPGPRMEEAPPEKQQVVMVPSWREGQEAKTPTDVEGAARAPALAPGSQPEQPEPGDLDYKGGN